MFPPVSKGPAFGRTYVDATCPFLVVPQIIVDDFPVLIDCMILHGLLHTYFSSQVKHCTYTVPITSYNLLQTHFLLYFKPSQNSVDQNPNLLVSLQ
jgi:hypothetical protein